MTDTVKLALPSSRAHQSLECVNFDPVTDQNRADLDNLVSRRIRPIGVGLKVEDNELAVYPTQTLNLNSLTGRLQTLDTWNRLVHQSRRNTR